MKSISLHSIILIYIITSYVTLLTLVNTEEAWIDPGDMFRQTSVLETDNLVLEDTLNPTESLVIDYPNDSIPNVCADSTCENYVKRFTLMLLRCLDLENGSTEENYEFHLKVKLTGEDLAILQKSAKGNVRELYELDEVVQKIFSKGPQKWSYLTSLTNSLLSLDIWAFHRVLLYFFGSLLFWSIILIQLRGFSFQRLVMSVFNLFTFGFIWNSRYIYEKNLTKKSVDINSCENMGFFMKLFYSDTCVKKMMADPLMETKPLFVLSESIGDILHVLSQFGKYLGRFYSNLSGELSILQAILLVPIVTLCGLLFLKFLVCAIFNQYTQPAIDSEKRPKQELGNSKRPRMTNHRPYKIKMKKYNEKKSSIPNKMIEAAPS